MKVYSKLHNHLISIILSISLVGSIISSSCVQCFSLATPGWSEVDLTRHRSSNPALEAFQHIYQEYKFYPFTTKDFMDICSITSISAAHARLNLLQVFGLLEKTIVGKNAIFNLKQFDIARLKEIEFVLSEYVSRYDIQIIMEQISAIFKSSKLFNLSNEPFKYSSKKIPNKIKLRALRSQSTFKFLRDFFGHNWFKINRAHSFTENITLSGLCAQIHILEESSILERHPSCRMFKDKDSSGIWVRLKVFDDDQVHKIENILRNYADHCDMQILKIDVERFNKNQTIESESILSFNKTISSLFPRNIKNDRNRQIKITLPSILNAIEKISKKKANPKLIDVAQVLGVSARNIDRFARTQGIELRKLGIWGIHYPKEKNEFCRLLDEADKRLRSGHKDYTCMPILIHDLADELRITEPLKLKQRAAVFGYNLSAKGYFMAKDDSNERIVYTMGYLKSIGMTPTIANIAYIMKVNKSWWDRKGLNPNDHRISPQSYEKLISIERKWRKNLPIRREMDRYTDVKAIIDNIMNAFETALMEENAGAVRRLRYALGVIVPGHPIIISSMDKSRWAELAFEIDANTDLLNGLGLGTDPNSNGSNIIFLEGGAVACPLKPFNHSKRPIDVSH